MHSHDKWCLYKSVRQLENDRERGFNEHLLKCIQETANQIDRSEVELILSNQITASGLLTGKIPQI